MASAKAKIRHVFGDTFSCRAAPPDILVKLSALATLTCTAYVRARIGHAIPLPSVMHIFYQKKDREVQNFGS